MRAGGKHPSAAEPGSAFARCGMEPARTADLGSYGEGTADQRLSRLIRKRGRAGSLTTSLETRECRKRRSAVGHVAAPGLVESRQ